MKKMTVKYEVLDQRSDTTNACIHIKEGKFKDFVYRYGTIQIGEEDEEKQDLPVNFDYELLEAPTSYEVDDEDVEKDEFEQTIGDILYDIFINQYGETVEANGNRNNDSK